MTRNDLIGKALVVLLATAVCLTAATAARAAVLLDWDFDSLNATPPEVTDGSGNGHNGTLQTVGTGSVAQVADGSGPFASNHLTFTGSGYGGAGRVNAGSPATLDTPGNYTLSAWFEAHSPTDNEMIASRYNDGANPGFALVYRYHPAQSAFNQVSYYHLPTSGSFFDIRSPSQYTAGWHHAVATFQEGGGGGGKLYVDGALVNSSTATTIGAVNATTKSFLVGAQDSSAERGFNGGIDEVQLHDTVLSGSQIKAMYLSALPQNRLNMHFEAELPPPNEVEDSAPMHMHGTKVGAVTHQPTGGPFGNSPGYYDFGGGHVAVNNAPPLDLDGDYSLSLWFQGHNAPANEVVAGRVNDGINAGPSLWFLQSDQLVFYHVSRGASEGGWLGNTIQTSATFSNGDEWHHAVAVFEEGVGSTLYIDGVKITAATASVFNPSVTTDGVSTFVPGFRIGAQDYSLNQRPFSAGIDELRLYDYALSSADAATLFSFNALAPEPSSLALLFIGALGFAMVGGRRRGGAR